MGIWNLLNSQLGLLLLGFGFTSVAGGLFARWLQEKSWYRQTKVDLFRKRYEEGVQFLDDLSELIGKRSFALQRLLWAIAEKHPQAAIDRLSGKYFAIVFQWNASYWKNRNKVRLLVGEEQANAFLDYTDNFRLEAPISLHYTFVKAHRCVLLARRGEPGSRTARLALETAQLELDRLKEVCSAFLEALTTDFADRANRLQLLAVPETDGRARRRRLAGIIDIRGSLGQLRNRDRQPVDR